MSLLTISTKKLNWEADCWDLLALRQPFALRDVTLAHLTFCEAFGNFTGWTFNHCSGVVTFTPPPSPGEKERKKLPHVSSHVLRARCRVLELEQNWTDLHRVALNAISANEPDPELLAFAAWAEHKLGRSTAAWSLLEIHASRFQHHSEFAFRFACLSAALGKTSEAKRWIRIALAKSAQPARMKLRLAQDAFPVGIVGD